MVSYLSSTHRGRQLIAQDTLERTEAIIEQCTADGASDNSTFYFEQLSFLPSSAGLNAKCRVSVVNGDAFTAARELLNEHQEAKGSVAVLNLASDEHRAGGWIHTLSRTQVCTLYWNSLGSVVDIDKEEALCYSSTLYSTLKPAWFPWPNLGPGSVAGGYSPGVVIFKDDLDHDCVDLPKEDWRVISVITVAAPRGPKLTVDGQSFENESDLNDLRGKIRLVYRIAAHNKKRYLVLGGQTQPRQCFSADEESYWQVPWVVANTHVPRNWWLVKWKTFSLSRSSVVILTESCLPYIVEVGTETSPYSVRSGMVLKYDLLHMYVLKSLKNVFIFEWRIIWQVSSKLLDNQTKRGIHTTRDVWEGYPTNWYLNDINIVFFWVRFSSQWKCNYVGACKW